MFKWNENKIYKGEWKNNAISGFGVFIQNGKVFKGDFINDQKHGFGINIFPNNSFILSKWEEDFMIGISLFFDKDDNFEQIYISSKGKPKKLIENQEEIEQIKENKEYLDLKSFLNDLKIKGMI